MENGFGNDDDFVDVPDFGGVTFLVARRELDEEEDIVILTPAHYIVGVPEDVDDAEMKMYLDKTGEADYHQWTWKNFRVIPESKWAEGKWTEDPRKWFRSNFSDDLPSGSAPWSSGTTYEYLASSIYDERRITLRLPVGLHVALSRAAKDKTTSLNSFCIKTLASVVNYGEDLEEFEAQRRKPGRPRKVETND